MQSSVTRILTFLWIAVNLNSKSDAFAPNTLHLFKNYNIGSQYHINLFPHIVGKLRQRIPEFRPTIEMKSQEKSTQLISSDKNVFAKIGSSTSKVVAGTFFIVLAYQRDCFILTFFIGSILNGITSKILKKVLNQDRPTGYENDTSIKVKPSDKGMPSSHAMSLGFIGIYTAIALCNGLLLDAGIGPKIATCFGLILYVSISLIYRVQSQLHTIAQVVVGLIVGTSNGVFWYSLAHGNNPLFPTWNIMDTVANTFLPENGIMPVRYLIFPLIVGAAVVGSIERRISMFLKRKKQ